MGKRLLDIKGGRAPQQEFRLTLCERVYVELSLDADALQPLKMRVSSKFTGQS